MKITKKLKHAVFSYDEDLKKFEIQVTPHGENNAGYCPGSTTISLNKIYAFAFMRFVIRMAQRNWLRGKKIVDKSDPNMISLTDYEEQIDPNQTTIQWIEESHLADEPF